MRLSMLVSIKIEKLVATKVDGLLLPKFNRAKKEIAYKSILNH